MFIVLILLNLLIAIVTDVWQSFDREKNIWKLSMMKLERLTIMSRELTMVKEVD